VSDAPHDTPSQAELDAKAFPAFVRRAPRFARMIATGVGLGFAAGVVMALALPGHGAAYRGAVALLVGLGFGLIGGLSAGAIATLVDGQDPRAGAPAWPSIQEVENAGAAELAPRPSTDKDG
jgi:hypothetical protein